MIEIRDLTFRYESGAGDALSRVSLSVPKGDFLGIIGPSGAGKSTLLFSINGVVPHHYKGDFYGEVSVKGLDTARTSPEKIALHVGSVFQDIESQMVASVVEDEILFGLENFGVPRDEIARRIDAALASAGMSDLRKRRISSLSGGQKQKLALASILALRPEIIVLDEPTGELDPKASRLIFETLRELNEKLEITVVIVEQKIMLLCEFVRRLAVMEYGRIILLGPVAEVLQSADVMEAAGVNIPRVTTLARELKRRGLYDGALPLNLSQAEEMMRDVLGRP
jgi:energy-coupling factor transport system ATP-binding protein